MAEHSAILPVTPTSTKADGGNLRRNSFGKATSSNGGGKVLPHYLRASTGSCHDFCKYGRKHAFEEKARRPFTRRSTKKPPDDQSSLELQTEKKMISAVKLKPSHNSKSYISDIPEVIKREVLAKSVDRKSPVYTEVQAKKSSTEVLLTKSVDAQAPIFTKVLAKKKLSPEVLLTKSVDSQRPKLREIIAKKKSSVQEVSTRSVDSQSSLASEIWAKKETSQQGRNKTIMVNRTSPQSRTHSSLKGVKRDVSSSSEKLEVLLKKSPSNPKEFNLSTKHASNLKPKLSSLDASNLVGGRRNSEIKKIQKTGSPRLTQKKVLGSPRHLSSLKTSLSVAGRGLASPRPSLSSRPSPSRVPSLDAKKHKSSKAASSLKKRNKVKNSDSETPNINNVYPDQLAIELKEPNKDMVQEKTLYVIKMETENKFLESEHNEHLSAESSPPPLSSPNSPSLPKSPSSPFHNEEDEEESECTVTDVEDGSVSEYDETECLEEAETFEGKHKGRHTKAGIVPSDDKDGQPMKVRFRRGKVVDIQSENNGPRRLKFRRGRVLGEHQNLKAAARRSFKKRGADGGTTDSNPDSEKVVLKHQEVNGKKDAQGLFNNVIEETASKLVETRKSKVKALVGAFETVISLQDSKPVANTVS